MSTLLCNEVCVFGFERSKKLNYVIFLRSRDLLLTVNNTSFLHWVFVPYVNNTFLHAFGVSSPTLGLLGPALGQLQELLPAGTHRSLARDSNKWFFSSAFCSISKMWLWYVTLSHPSCGDFAAARVTDNLGLRKKNLLTLTLICCNF